MLKFSVNSRYTGVSSPDSGDTLSNTSNRSLRRALLRIAVCGRGFPALRKIVRHGSHESPVLFPRTVDSRRPSWRTKATLDSETLMSVYSSLPLNTLSFSMESQTLRAKSELMVVVTGPELSIGMFLVNSSETPSMAKTMLRAAEMTVPSDSMRMLSRPGTDWSRLEREHDWRADLDSIMDTYPLF